MENEEKKYPEAIVGALVVNKEGKIILAKSKKWDGKYTIFGGHVEMGEKLEDAVLREIKEESNLDVKVVARLGFDESVYNEEFHENKHFVFIDFLCSYDGEDNDVKIGDKEFENKFVWVTTDEALKMDIAHGTREIIESYLKYQESTNCLDSWKRCQADFENYKKDQVKHQEEFRKYAKMDVTLQILPVLDNFEISLEHVPEEKKGNGWVEGIVHIKRQIEDVLKNNGVEEIAVKEGDKFDPEIHEAISGKGEKVKKVLQKGYKLNRRIIRAARVEVG